MEPCSLFQPFDLQESWRQTLLQLGFVSLPEFVADESLRRLLGQLDRFLEEVVPIMPQEEVYFEQVGRLESLKQLQRLHLHDPYFHRLLNDSVFTDLARFLLQEEPVGQNVQYFSKPPGQSSATPPHQDGYYFKLQPCHALTLWLALDDVTEEAGCLRYVAGSHRDGLRPHAFSGTLGFSQALQDWQERDEQREVSLPCRKGHLLGHHALTIHHAEANQSHRSRRALGFIYFAASAREDQSAHADYQRKLADEWRRRGKI